MPWRLCGLREILRRHPFTARIPKPSIFPSRFFIQCSVPSAVRMLSAASATLPAAPTVLPHTHRKPKHTPTQRRQQTTQTQPVTREIADAPSQFLALLDCAMAPRQLTVAALLRKIEESPQLHTLLTDRERVCAIAEKLAATNRPNRVHLVLRLAHRLRASLKQSVYERIVYRLAEAKHWHLVPMVVDLGGRQLGKSNIRLLNWRARALVELQNFALLGKVFDDFLTHGLLPNRRTFHIVLRGYLSNHDIGGARVCMRKMVEAGLPVDSSTHAVIVSAYRGFGPDEQVVALANQSLSELDEKAQTTILNSLMRLSLDRNDFIGASRILKIFDQRQSGCASVVPSQPAHIAQSRKGDVEHKTVKAHTAASQDTATYAMLINFLGPKRDSQWVTSIFQRMKSSNLIPDGGVAAALIRAYFHHGSIELATAVAEEICRPLHLDQSLFRDLYAGAVTTPLTFGPFLSGPTTEVFNAFLRGVLESQGFSATRKVLRIMNAAQVHPNAATLEVLLSHLESRENARPNEIIRVLRWFTSHQIRPTLRHLHIILRSALRKERVYLRGVGWNNTAQRLAHGWRPRAIMEPQTFGEATFFDPLAGIALPAQLSIQAPVGKILESLFSCGIKSDRATIALRMKHDAVTRADLPTAHAVFQAMIDRGMHPTAHHYAALMEGYAEVGDMKAAAEMMERAVANNITSNVVMHTILIAGHARCGRPDLAMGAFQNMLRSGIEPDHAAVDAVASAFFAVKAFKLARQTLIDLWPFVATFPEELREAPLKTLAHTLRATRPFNRRPYYATTSMKQKRALRWKLRRIARMWAQMTSSDFVASSGVVGSVTARRCDTLQNNNVAFSSHRHTTRK